MRTVSGSDGEQRVVSASRVIQAPPRVVFGLIADPSLQPTWDGNDNLRSASRDQRVRAVGDVFTMTLTKGSVRENHVVEFEESRTIAWKPSEVGAEPPGHLWRWELEPLDDDATRATHSYDWTLLTDPNRFGRARTTAVANLTASLDRLAEVAEKRHAEEIIGQHVAAASFRPRLDLF